jgi:hypothetical protein
LLQLHSTCWELPAEVHKLLLLLHQLPVLSVQLGPTLCLVRNQAMTTPAVSVGMHTEGACRAARRRDSSNR